MLCPCMWCVSKCGLVTVVVKVTEGVAKTVVLGLQLLSPEERYPLHTGMAARKNTT
jgi:hypothetical protein